MQTTEAIIEKLGGPSVLARSLDRPVATVSAWKHRKSIPSKYWPQLIAHASSIGVDLTYEALASPSNEAA